MTNRRDPVERATDRLQDFAIAHAPIRVLVVASVALFVTGIVFAILAPIPGLPGRLLIFGPTAIGAAAGWLARWTHSERRYIAEHHDPH